MMMIRRDSRIVMLVCVVGMLACKSTDSTKNTGTGGTATGTGGSAGTMAGTSGSYAGTGGVVSGTGGTKAGTGGVVSGTGGTAAGTGGTGTGGTGTGGTGTGGHAAGTGGTGTGGTGTGGTGTGGHAAGTGGSGGTPSAACMMYCTCMMTNCAASKFPNMESCQTFCATGSQTAVSCWNTHCTNAGTMGKDGVHCMHALGDGTICPKM